MRLPARPACTKTRAQAAIARARHGDGDAMQAAVHSPRECVHAQSPQSRVNPFAQIPVPRFGPARRLPPRLALEAGVYVFWLFGVRANDE